MTPYRSGRALGAPDAAPEAGLVDEMVRQFADPYAFLRELAQNGIDAGATRIAVTIERDGDGVVRTSVDDDGTGMTRSTIEGPLLTLFQSSKESDATKIGKYGVGFMSVFATRPERVEVRTRARSGARAEGWIVHLFRDHGFELAEDEPGDPGTIVTLVHVMDGDVYEEHVRRAAAALARWCRHAHVPITLDGRAVNEPFGVEGAMSIVHERDGTRWAIGVGSGSGSFVGYYNRGLTLFETAAPEHGLEGIRLKIDSPRLAHTLSRDNVRRDAALRDMLAGAAGLVRGPLWERLEAAVAAAAVDVAAAGQPDRVRALAALYDAVGAPAFVRERGDEAQALAVPLVDPVDGASTMPIHRVGDGSRGALLTSEASTPLTRALARRRIPVVRGGAVAAALLRLTSAASFDDATHRFAHASPADVAAHPGDDALVAEIARLARETGRPIGRVCLAAFTGAPTSIPYRAVETEDDDAVMTPAASNERWSRRATLFLDADDAVVRLARKRASRELETAAHLLFRSILLTRGPLAADDVDRLLSAAARARDA